MADVDLSDAEAWMERCIALAHRAAGNGNYALGAIVVRDGDVLAESGSSLIESDDPSAHPELVVVREACRQAGSRYLSGAVLVTTLEPCVMCTGVAIWAKMAAIVFGATQGDAIAWSAEHPDPQYTWRQIAMPCRDVVDRGVPRLQVREGVLRPRCVDLFRLTASAGA